MTDIIIAEPMEDCVVRELGLRYEIRYDRRLAFDLDALGFALAEARALIVGDRTIIDAELLAAAPRLQVIGCLGTDLGRVDSDACRARGIEVHTAPHVRDSDRAGQAAGTVSDLLARVHGTADGRLLGLVGFGPIAREVARRAQMLCMRVAAYDPLLDREAPAWRDTQVEPMPLYRLLDEADAISVHLPLTEETHELIDWETITQMRGGAVLVNASHSAIVDAAAVNAALRSGRLGGAVLDLDAERVDGLALLPEIRIGALIAAKVQATLDARQPA
ncbi:NAD(P)-dependent oxidoreductase [Arenibaculum sp.]|uniref:NAD(P)-dependent oxidoreductase n=1 Tax=Arenibaculum sp. TaxID=2865862 RepID=UPI002E121DD4|nr:NAD(P)-dependent oxidoreductase [Arenibaculum sp.]